MSIATDPNGPAIKSLTSLLDNYPIAAFGEAYVQSKLQSVGVNYQTDIHPLFGNPIMLGLADPSGTSARTLLIAWVTKDAGALDTLVQKFHLQKTRTYDGATLYRASSVAIAVDGPTVLLGTSQQAVQSALDRGARGHGISEAHMSSAVSGLPPNPFIQAFGNLSGVLAARPAAKARSVPWIGALRGYGVGLNASVSGLTLNFKLDTTGASLTPSQLPIASGTSPPSLAGNAPIEVALQNPAQVAAFLVQAQELTSPGSFVTRQATLRKKTGVDLTSLLGLLTGELVIDSDAHNTIARVALSNPAAAAGILAKLATQPSGVFPNTTLTRGSGGFYVIHEKQHTIDAGIVGPELVAGEASPSQLRAFASAPSAPAPAGSHGSVAFQIALPALIQLAVKNAPAQLQTVLASLGNITGWVSATPQATSGRAALALK